MAHGRGAQAGLVLEDPVTRRRTFAFAAMLLVAAAIAGWRILSRSSTDEHAAPATHDAPASAALPSFEAVVAPAPAQLIEVSVEPAPPAAAAPAEDPFKGFVWAGQDPNAAPYRIVGRVLMPDGVTPAVGARVRLDDAAFKPRDDDSQVTDEAGRFTFEPTRGLPFEDAQLFALSADELAWAVRMDVDSDAKGDKDLGDVVLEVLRRVTLRVLDEAGRPIEGAVAGLLGDELGVHDRADADGLLMLEPITPTTHGLIVWSRDHARRQLELPDPLPLAPLEVVLAPCPVLTVRVVEDQGTDPAGSRVEIRSEGPLFGSPYPEGSPFAQPRDRLARLLDLSEPDGILHARGPDGRPEAGLVCVYQCWRGQPLVLGDLLAGTELQVALLDAAGVPMGEPSKLTLGPAEHRELELRPPPTARTVEVRVRDPEGKPVNDGLVMLNAPGAARGGLESCDAEGFARFEHVAIRSADITVMCPPWARVKLHDVVLPQGVPVDVMLATGLELAVSLVDVAGRPAQAEAILVAIDGDSFPYLMSSPDEEPKSQFVVDMLPPRLVRLTVSHAGKRSEHDVDARQGAVTLTVPWSDAPR
jgi:hypothetical protein